ncbi:DMT family transporter [Caenimonas sedimenti]|uniref:DMT family transporter n=1 Tax=Caenimonas sedimenti TaxID=2596921 RepID=A0A562ZUT0_9BURK|nr:DMT family transporter [Caenimonas sedimenti]TWO72352.1 DMT family transporter [Caenimonas sedimenti]
MAGLPATGLLLAAAGSITFAVKAIIVKLSYRHGVDPVTLIMLRMLFALPIFVVMAWWASRGKPPLTRSEWLGVAGLGFVGYYLSSFLDFVGLQYITAGLERLIIYVTPTVVLLLGWLLYRKTWTRAQMAGMAVSYGGVLLVFGREASLSGANVALGAVLVFASTITYSIYLVYSGELVRRIGSLRLVGLATTVACICCIAQFLLLRPVAVALAVAPEVVWLSLLNATLGTALPVLLVMMAIERIGAAATAQIGMIGPLATIALGIWLLGEPFTLWLAAGTALVLVGIFTFTRAPPASKGG